MIHGLLPSRGPDLCPLREGCPCNEDPEMRELCIPGADCAWEAWFHRRYVDSAREKFQRCLRWLTEEERDHIISELSTVQAPGVPYVTEPVTADTGAVARTGPRDLVAVLRTRHTHALH